MNILMNKVTLAVKTRHWRIKVVKATERYDIFHVNQKQMPVLTISKAKFIYLFIYLLLYLFFTSASCKYIESLFFT